MQKVVQAIKHKATRSTNRAYHISQANLLRLTLLGAPGSGKGTQAEKIQRDFKSPQISTGQILRDAILAKTPLGLLVEETIKRGELVKDEVMFDLVRDALRSKQRWLLDGYPRTIRQADQLFALLDELKLPLHAALYIKVDPEVIIERIENRLVHPASGRTYHKIYKPPKVAYKDDLTGEDLIQRPDDTRESILIRLDQFNAYAEPLLQYYTKKNVLKVIPSPNSDVGYVHIKQLLIELDDKLIRGVLTL